MKIEKSGDNFNQSVRFNNVCDDLGWNYLSPMVQKGSLSGSIDVFSKKKLPAGNYEFDKSAPKTVSDPEGIWAERADGIPVGRGEKSSTDLKERLAKVKSDDVIRAALLDGLTASRDRHEDNLLIGKDGSVALIDNTSMFSSQFRSNSLFTGTRKDESRPELEVLDYRTHVDNGEIGTDYPSEFKNMLETITSSSEDDLVKKYAFKDIKKAGIFKKHASSMLKNGFEAACGIGDRWLKEWIQFWRPVLAEELGRHDLSVSQIRRLEHQL